MGAGMGAEMRARNVRLMTRIKNSNQSQQERQLHLISLSRSSDTSSTLHWFPFEYHGRKIGDMSYIKHQDCRSECKTCWISKK